MLLAWGRSHRTSDGRRAHPLGRSWRASRRGSSGRRRRGARHRRGRPRPARGRRRRRRKRIRVNGVAAPGRRRWPAPLRVVLFAPEEMLLVAGSPSLRRAALDLLAGQRSPALRRATLATYGRALQQRNGLLRAIREEQRRRATSCGSGTRPSSTPAARIVEERQRLLDALAGPLAARPRRDRARGGRGGGADASRYATNAPAARRRDAAGRPGAPPRRDRREGGLERRDAHRAASRRPRLRAGRPRPGRRSRRAGQQRTAILAFKLAELDLLTALDGRPPLLLLDDVFSELDPDRRGHLVRRIAALPQAFVTTTTLDDLDPALRGDRDGVGRCGRGRPATARRWPRPTPATRSRWTPRRRAIRTGRAVTTPAPADAAPRRPDPGRGPRLGLEDELRLARAIATWRRDRRRARPGRRRVVPARPHGGGSRWSSRPTRRSSRQELRLRATELLAAFAAAPGRASACRELRVHVRVGRVPRGYNPRHLPAASRGDRPRSNRERPLAPTAPLATVTRRRARPTTERPAWPSDSR